ncbi:MAG: hypothetical protein F2520_01220 [Actinobacteria bacterium]|nr:hypothetical protein [Actinomycetota bacterium]MTA76861.1 hypothetical protein [Actinomycetota bacterium]
MLIVGALGLEFLRRRSLVEFPDSRADMDLDGMKRSVAGVWTSVSGRVRSLGGSSVGDADPVEKLSKLQALHASGALTDDEFSSAKAKVLSPDQS